MARKAMYSIAAAVFNWRIASIGVMLLVLVFVLIACSGSAELPSSNNIQSNTVQKPSGSIKAVWIETVVDVDTVSIPLSLVDDNWNTHFKLPTTAGDFNYMAYRYNDETHVRANVCPPCGSIGYSLDGDNLVCDMCATTFEAETGDGIVGACVDFPKAEVPYEIRGGDIVMKGTNLIAAYQNTLKPGLP